MRTIQSLAAFNRLSASSLHEGIELTGEAIHKVLCHADMMKLNNANIHIPARYLSAPLCNLVGGHLHLPVAAHINNSQAIGMKVHCNGILSVENSDVDEVWATGVRLDKSKVTRLSSEWAELQSSSICILTSGCCILHHDSSIRTYAMTSTSVRIHGTGNSISLCGAIDGPVTNDNECELVSENLGKYTILPSGTFSVSNVGSHNRTVMAFACKENVIFFLGGFEGTYEQAEATVKQAYKGRDALPAYLDALAYLNKRCTDVRKLHKCKGTRKGAKRIG